MFVDVLVHGADVAVVIEPVLDLPKEWAIQIRQAALQAFVESLDEVELRRALVERPRLGRELGDQVAFYPKGRVGVSDLGTLGGMGEQLCWRCGMNQRTCGSHTDINCSRCRKNSFEWQQ